MSEPREPDLTQAELDKLTKQRRVLVRNRVASQISIAEDLITIIDTFTSRESKIGRTVENLLTELAGLVAMASANRSSDPRNRRGRTEIPVPSFKPAWASQRLDQVDRKLHAETEALRAWLHRPHDPKQRPDVCGRCGHPPTRDDLCCRQCGHRLNRDSARPKARCAYRDCDAEGLWQTGRTDIPFTHCTSCGRPFTAGRMRVSA